MATHERGGSGAQWAVRWWRAIAAEGVSTALLVALGVVSLLPRLEGDKHVAPPLTHISMAFGFAVLINVMAFGPISGAHMNPAVTLAALLDRRITAVPAVAYISAQCAGAGVGFGVAMMLAPTGTITGGLGCTFPAAGVTAIAAVATEAILTAGLVFVCCALWSSDAPDPAAPVKLGLAVVGLIYSGGCLSGASLNPARSLAPALYHNIWTDHWVYWVGPLGGACIGVLLHRVLRTTTEKPRDPHVSTDELPLRNKSQP